MIDDLSRRNTRKEKIKNNKRFPYQHLNVREDYNKEILKGGKEEDGK